MCAGGCTLITSTNRKQKMTKYAIRCTEVDYSVAAKFFGKRGFEFGAPLVAQEQAKTFKTKKAADEFLVSMKASGFKCFAVDAIF